jgi:8-oxo-dGTP pyrophosphatase MutT (NUDIX family)
MLAALKREVSEETGLECKSARVLDTYHNSSISKRDHVVIYVLEDWQEEQAHEPPKLEIAEAAWFKLDDLPAGLTPCTEFGLRRYQLNYS